MKRVGIAAKVAAAVAFLAFGVASARNGAEDYRRAPKEFVEH